MLFSSLKDTWQEPHRLIENIHASIQNHEAMATCAETIVPLPTQCI